MQGVAAAQRPTEARAAGIRLAPDGRWDIGGRPLPVWNIGMNYPIKIFLTWTILFSRIQPGYAKKSHRHSLSFLLTKDSWLYIRMPCNRRTQFPADISFPYFLSTGKSD